MALLDKNASTELHFDQSVFSASTFHNGVAFALLLVPIVENASVARRRVNTQIPDDQSLEKKPERRKIGQQIIRTGLQGRSCDGRVHEVARVRGPNGCLAPQVRAPGIRVLDCEKFPQRRKIRVDRFLLDPVSVGVGDQIGANHRSRGLRPLQSGIRTQQPTSSFRVAQRPVHP